MLSLNKLIYLNPQPSYHSKTFDGHQKLKLLFIRTKQNKHQIPCLFIKANSDEYLLYFHSNAEDIGTCYEFTSALSNGLNLNVICMEYPGYGIYTQVEPSQQQIEKDAEDVFIYINLELRVPDSKLTIFGRSIGTGPACFLASIYQPKALILLSPFTSIKAVAKKHFYFAANLLKDQFDNVKRANKIICPCIIIHGKLDKFIPIQMAEDIYKSLASKRKTFFYPEDKDHNNFNFSYDINDIVYNFIKEIEQLNHMFSPN
ncbi:unnamed protein product [Paramecium pentaurelia]|uniref:Serine aminopeptidase S33 domain-containing protein n=1 Tax=Paramecium pentaurelia TaxID=43138 RepID=A0A8S1T723_9CILI|nr:unnamed protein product [Paramecium pentaurelia]